MLSYCLRCLVSLHQRGQQQDGDATDASSWTCSSGQACELTYDLGGVESLEQLRIGETFLCDTLEAALL